MREHRLVHAAIFLLVVAVSLIYALFFEAKGESVRQDVVTILRNWWVDAVSLSWTIVQTGTVVATWTTSGETTGIDTVMTVTGEDSFLQEVLGTSSGTILSGTTLYYGSLDILKTLGIRYEYILKDAKYDIFYAYIGKNVSYNIGDLVRGIWWKTVEIYAKNDIINNLYFGDRVIFVEWPQQTSAITNVFVRMWSDTRMIQDVTWQYKQHKRHIRSVFTAQP